MARGGRMGDVFKALEEQGMAVEHTSKGHYKVSDGARFAVVSVPRRDWSSFQETIATLRREVGFKWPWTRDDRLEARRVRPDLSDDDDYELVDYSTPSRPFHVVFDAEVQRAEVGLDELARLVGCSSMAVLEKLRNGHLTCLPRGVRDSLVDLFPKLADAEQIAVVEEDDEHDPESEPARRQINEPPLPPPQLLEPVNVSTHPDLVRAAGRGAQSGAVLLGPLLHAAHAMCGKACVVVELSPDQLAYKVTAGNCSSGWCRTPLEALEEVADELRAAVEERRLSFERMGVALGVRR